MARSLTARQDRLAGARALRPIPLVTITTYSDRVAETVDAVYRLSTRDLTYAGQRWLPLVERIETLREEMPHIPNAERALGEIERSLTIVFRNAEIDAGTYLIAALQADNMLNARVEVSQLLLDEGEQSYDAIRGLAGTEHVVFYRGVLAQMPSLRGGEFSLRFEAEIPSVPQEVLPSTSTVAPKDRGKTVPIIYGRVKKLPLLNYSVGPRTTIDNQLNLTSGTISITCTDLSDFSSSGSGHIGAEAISWTGKTGNTLTGVTRGTQAVHQAGTVLIEEQATTFKAIIGQKGCMLEKLYMRNLVTDGLFAFGAGTLSQDDTSVFGSGRGVTTLELSPAEVENAIQKTISAARVTAQAEYDTPGGGGTTLTLLQPGILTQVADDVFPNFSQNPVGLPSPQISRASSGQIAIRLEIDPTAVAGNTNVVLSARVVIRLVQNQFNTFYTTVRDRLPFWLSRLDSYGMQTPFGLADRSVLASGVHYPGTSNVGGSPPYSSHEQTVDLVSEYLSVAPGLTVEDLGNVGFYVFLDPMGVHAGGDSHVSIPTGFFGIEVETVTAPAVERVTDAVIAAAAGGNTLELWGDVQGPYVPAGKGDDGDGTYNDDSGILINRFSDTLRHFIVEHCGGSYADIDQASFDAVNTTFGGSQEVGAWLNPPNRDADFASMIGALCFDFRSQLVRREGASGTLWALQSPTGNTAKSWPSATVAITQWEDVEEIGRLGDNVRTAFAALYAIDFSLDGLDAYQEVAKADADASDLTSMTAAMLATAEAKFGSSVHAGFVFDSWGYGVTPPLDAVLSYYIANVISTLSTFRLIGVPWVEAYGVERGDIISFQPAWRSSAVEGRVIATVKDWRTNLIELTAVEVGP